MDEYLNWDEQDLWRTYFTKEAENIIPQRKLCSVYYAIVEIHLHYAGVIWGSLPA